MPNLASEATKAALTGDWKKAIEVNTEILSQNPEDINALNRLAHAYFSCGKRSEACKTYRKVLSIDPYNLIAQKNLRKASPMADEETQASQLSSTLCLFIEEPGKTKIADLINPAPQKILATLSPGHPVELIIKKHSVAIFRNGDYLGALPDDLSHRLINLTRAGNKYQAFVKAVKKNNLQVFLQEVRSSKRLRGQPSFPQGINDDFYPFVQSKTVLGFKRESTEDLDQEDSEVTDEESEEN
ncbi:tetratricopeptide repeat protein [Candidatus Microgenomates bacterium]|nr:tetratricopeptide repeat protein [Candidatus Microgenomates bacterium]